MKKFIAFCILTIGLMLVWPPGNYVKASTSDQVCFVVDVGHADYITIEKNSVLFQCSEFVAEKPPVVCVAENVIQKIPDFYSMYALNYRTCLQMMVVRGNNKLITSNKASHGIIRIRDDTSV